jgi:hypothetical protein
MQQMFLKLHDIKDSEKRDFILETLRKEFRDVVIEARKVFERFNMLGSRVDVVGTNKEEIKVPIPFKLVGMHEALEKNFDWIVSENPFDESSEPKSVHRCRGDDLGGALRARQYAGWHPGNPTASAQEDRLQPEGPAAPAAG